MKIKRSGVVSVSFWILASAFIWADVFLKSYRIALGKR